MCVLFIQLREGVLVTWQDKEWKAEDKSKKTHTKPCFWRDTQGKTYLLRMCADIIG